ncbi:MAG: hypothetical protein WBI17_09750 [Clostridiaceae bacterium]
MNTLFKLIGKIVVENEEANEQIDETTDNAEESSNKMVDSFKKIGLAVAGAFAIDKIIDFGKEIVGASADVSAEQSAFTQIMGGFSDEAQKKLEKVADDVGAVDTRLTPFMTSMTAKFKGLGFGIEESTDLASRGLTLASDASAFWDKTTDEAMGSLNSFINGSYEGGEAIGLFANDSQLASYAVKEGLVSEAKEWSSLEEAKKQATRLAYAEDMMKASGAVGQASKEAGEYANTQANLTEQWRQFKAQIGEPVLQNVVLPAMATLSGLVEGMIGFVGSVKENWAQWETPLTIVGIALGTLTTAIIAYNIAQKASAISTALSTMATTAWGAVMAFVTSPITLVILGIGALIAIGVLLYKNWDTISAKTSEVFDKVKIVVGESLDKVKGLFSGIIGWVKENWQGLLLLILNPFAGAFKLIYDNNEKFRTKIDTFVSGVKTTISNVFGTIKGIMTEPFDKAKGIIGGVVDKIRGFLDFKWSFPTLKMPHFSIKNASLNPLDWITKGAPKLAIDWYAKGGILTKPTMFGYNPQTGRAKVGGEAGDEAVAPIDVLLGYVRTAVQEENNGIAEGINRLIAMLSAYFPQILQGMDRDVVLNDGALIGRLAPAMDAKLGELYKGKGRGR